MIAEVSRAASKTLWRYPKRTIVMLSAVAIGVATFSGIYTVSDNTKQETIKRIRNMLGTTDTLLVRPGASSRGMVSLANIQPTLKPADAEDIAAEVPGVAEVGQLLNAFAIEAKYRDKDTVTGVFGVTPNWLRVRHESVAKGGFIDAADESSRNRVAVIGSDVAQELFGTEDPIGKTIRLEEVPFEVKGILSRLGSGPTGFSLDNVVDIPLSTASRRLLNRDVLTMAVVRLSDPSEGRQVAARITSLLRIRHHLSDMAPSDFNLTDPKAVMDQLTRVTSTLGRVLNALAIIALLIGGTVVATLMQLAVGQRRREIGLRRAVGAAKREILLQFAIEAIFTSLAGGSIGIIIGVGATNLVAVWQKLPIMFSATVIGEAFAISVAIGIGFGIFPAISAARVDPIAALRS
jgi:putative ABC transport system permease protein